MLDAVFPWGARVRAFRSRSISTQIASEPWQLAGYFRLREHVFSQEQGLFSGSDRDLHDANAIAIVALSQSAGMPDAVVGVVRIYPATAGVWFGGRLAVNPLYRRHGIVGESLIRTAVGTALGAGCTRFLATVQAANVRYFERHHFERIAETEVCGRPHALMSAALGCFQPLPARAEVAA